MTTTTSMTSEARPAAPRESRTFVGILAPGPAAMERVAGIEVSKRAAIVLRRHGCSRIVLRGSTSELGALLARDPRIGVLDPASDLASDERAILVAGDVTFPLDLLRELSARADGSTAFAACDAGLLFVGPATVANEISQELENGGGIGRAVARVSAVGSRVESSTLRAAVSPAERAAATRAILQATGKAVDGPLTRLFERRISQAISSILLPLPVSPNVMTTVSFAIGLLGAGLLATTDYTLRVVGAALFVFATIVDGCDGEIARSKFMESRFGKLYDTAVDIVVNAAVFLGIGVGTWRELNGVADVRWATLLLVGGGVLAMAVVESVRRVTTAASPESVLGRAQGWLEWFATVEWCYLVLGLAILDQIPFFFFGAAVGANVFALVYLTLGVLAWRRG